MKASIATRFFGFGVFLIALFQSSTTGAEESVKRSDPMRAAEHFGRRVGDEKAKSVREMGGTKESETAVAAALKWLAAHQMDDGGWHFDHRAAAMCGGRCDHSGSLEARNAATAMALLCFLGAGQSQVEGEYKAVVRKGLGFLIARGKKVEKSGLSFHESGGSMYSHGLATLALCEAYGLTRDMTMQRPAQEAVNFISLAQDRVGGGWRYQPLQAGDTSVTGWQLLALVTADDARLEVPAATIKGTIKFLDSVAADDGAFYGYTTPGRGKATTSISLLCRMHTGWEHGEKPLRTGVEWLAAQGPSATTKRNTWYYNFYATQVLWQYGGEAWTKWNEKMREHLVASQEKDGHAAGSWYIAGDHGSARGGRLYCTAFAALILETYYRNKPIYELE